MALSEWNVTSDQSPAKDKKQDLCLNPITQAPSLTEKKNKATTQKERQNAHMYDFDTLTLTESQEVSKGHSRRKWHSSKESLP